MDDDELSADFLAPDVVEARAVLGRAISDYLDVLRGEEQPFVVAWVVAAEWTNPDLEQTGRAGRDVVSPTEQTLSASVGLGAFIASRYT